MSAIATLSESYDYDPHNHDRAAWWAHHRTLIANLERARLPRPFQGRPSYPERLPMVILNGNPSSGTEAQTRESVLRTVRERMRRS